MYKSVKKYIDFKVYSVTRIKNKYGFRIVFTLSDNSLSVRQKSGFSTKKEANRFRDIVIIELYNGTFVMDDRVTTEDFMTYWLEEFMKKKITNDSYDTYKNVIYNHINPKIGKIRLSVLNKSHVQNLYQEIYKESLSTAKLCKTILKSSLNQALCENLVSSNVAEDIKLPRKEEIKIAKQNKNNYRTIRIDVAKTLNEDQIRVIIEKSRGTPIHFQILFAVLMGLRRGEINGLKYSDVDLVHRKLKIQRQLGKMANVSLEKLKKGEYTKQEIPVKTFSSNRELDIPDIVFEAILEEKKKYEKNKKRRLNDKTNPFKDYGFIRCSNYGNPRSKSFHFKYYKKLLEDNNLPNIRFHDLRKSYCTLLLKNNINDKAVSSVMGHSSSIISIDVYGDNEEIISDCLKELEPFIQEVVPKKEEKNGDEFLENIEDLVIYEYVTWMC